MKKTAKYTVIVTLLGIFFVFLYLPSVVSINYAGYCFFLAVNENGLERYELLTFSDEGSSHGFEYQGQKYCRDNEDWFAFNQTSQDIQLVTWTFALVTDKFYSYSTEHPDYIVAIRGDEVFFRDDFDFENEVYRLKPKNSNSEITIRLKDMYIKNTGSEYDWYSDSRSDFEACCEKYPELTVAVDVVKEDGKYYVNFGYSNIKYEVSPQFYEVLIQN